MAETSSIGRLRSIVLLYFREQLPDPDSTGILELPKELTRLYAEVTPMRAVPFYGAVAVNGPDAPTHIIETRWNDYVDQRHAFVRTSVKPDGTQRTEVFRVRRALGDFDGRKRRSRYECQLETVE